MFTFYLNYDNFHDLLFKYYTFIIDCNCRTKTYFKLITDIVVGR